MNQFRITLFIILLFHSINGYAQACNPGKFGPSGMAPCSDCAAGSFANSSGSSSCTLCSPGYFQSNTGATTCISCSPGKAQADEGQTSCDDCEAGFFTESSGNAECSACPVGRTSETGSTECTLCNPGTFASSEGSICQECSAGTFSSDSGSSICSDCPSGTFIADSGATTCFQCEEGTFSDSGQTTCTECSEGTYSSDSGNSSCSDCPTGTYSEAGAVVCSNCPIGTVAENVGSSDCVNCSGGTYALTEGENSCIECGRFTKSSLIHFKNIDEINPDKKDRIVGKMFLRVDPEQYENFDPYQNGLQIIVEDGSNSKLVNLNLSGGAYLEENSRGWRIRDLRRKKNWFYKDDSSSPQEGISSVRILGQNRCGRKACRIRLIARGSMDDYAFDAESPVLSIVVGSGSSLCFRQNFSSRQCRFRRDGERIFCKK